MRFIYKAFKQRLFIFTVFSFNIDIEGKCMGTIKIWSVDIKIKQKAFDSFLGYQSRKRHTPYLSMSPALWNGSSEFFSSILDCKN